MNVNEHVDDYIAKEMSKHEKALDQVKNLHVYDLGTEKEQKIIS